MSVFPLDNHISVGNEIRNDMKTLDFLLVINLLLLHGLSIGEVRAITYLHKVITSHLISALH